MGIMSLLHKGDRVFSLGLFLGISFHGWSYDRMPLWAKSLMLILDFRFWFAESLWPCMPSGEDLRLAEVCCYWWLGHLQRTNR